MTIDERMMLQSIMTHKEKLATIQAQSQSVTPQLSRLDYIATQIYTAYLTISTGECAVRPTCRQAVYEAQQLIDAIAEAEGKVMP